MALAALSGTTPNPSNTGATVDAIRLLLSERALVRGLEPLHGILLRQTVGGTNSVALVFSAANTLASATQHYVEIHTVNACPPWRHHKHAPNTITHTGKQRHTNKT